MQVSSGLLEQSKVVKAVVLERSIVFNKLPEQFKVVKAVNPSKPVKSVRELLETSNEVTAARLEFSTTPFLPSVSIPRAISLSSNNGLGIRVLTEQSNGEKKA